MNTDVALVPLGKITPYPQNENKHTDAQIKRLASIIAYQGFRVPLIVSNQSGFIVCGHGRFMAAKKLKLKHVPVSFQDFETPDMEAAQRVADNAIADWSELDFSLINEIMPDLGPDFNLELLGISEFKLDAFEKEEPEQKEQKLYKCPHCNHAINKNELEEI